MIAQWGGGKGQTLHIRLQSKQNVLVYKRYQRVSGINLWYVSGLATFWTILYCLDLFVSMLSVMQKVCHVDYNGAKITLPEILRKRSEESTFK